LYADTRQSSVVPGARLNAANRFDEFSRYDVVI